jgi:hypothetical protein
MSLRWETLPWRMDDVRAVMDATGSERAALMGSLDGAALALAPTLRSRDTPERSRMSASSGAERYCSELMPNASAKPSVVITPASLPP